MEQVLYGSELAIKLKSQMKEELSLIKVSEKRQPMLAVVLVGDDPASLSYVKGKEKACEEIGMESRTYRLDGNSSIDDVLALVQQLNDDNTVDGILVQLPLPSHLDSDVVIEAIRPDKDVDGLTPVSLGRFFAGRSGFKPCTPLGVMEILQEGHVELEGKHAVVIGRSQLVGKPIAQLLLNANCTVTTCHSKTIGLQDVCKHADILIVAIGKPKFVDASFVKQGAVVIDVGINRVNGKLVGDVDFDSVAPLASLITPVPKGVGPMTITMLLENTLTAYKHHIGK